MRIFTAVRHSNDPSQFYGGLWSANFYPALRQLGHEIVESQTDLQLTSRFMDVADSFTAEELAARARTTERILAEVSAAHRARPIHLFLSYFYNAHFDPAGFDDLRRLGIVSVNFFCNSIYQFELVAAIAPRVDVSWHAERDARALYASVGARPVWVQMGADPVVYRPVVGYARQPSACFVGQCYADRDQWMAAVILAGVPVEIYGPGWGGPAPTGASQVLPDNIYLGRRVHRPGSAGAYARVVGAIVARDGLPKGLGRVGRLVRARRASRRLAGLFPPFARGPLPFERIADVFARHEVCLNFSNVWADGRPGSVLIPHVRLRDFEAPMCRTCYLTGHTDEIEAFYDVGREIDTYRVPEELVDKARFYLAHPTAAERLREAGHRRAVRDHTWTRRFESLFTQIGLPA